MDCVVHFSQRLGHLHFLEGTDLVSSIQQSLDDQCTHSSSNGSIRFDYYKRAFQLLHRTMSILLMPNAVICYFRVVAPLSETTVS